MLYIYVIYICYSLFSMIIQHDCLLTFFKTFQPPRLTPKDAAKHTHVRASAMVRLDVPRTFASERTAINTAEGMGAVETVLVAHALLNPKVTDISLPPLLPLLWLLLSPPSCLLLPPARPLHGASTHGEIHLNSLPLQQL